jgi:hypothetical protein
VGVPIDVNGFMNAFVVSLLLVRTGGVPSNAEVLSVMVCYL